jgi:hypothetical protein
MQPTEALTADQRSATLTRRVAMLAPLAALAACSSGGDAAAPPPAGDSPLPTPEAPTAADVAVDGPAWGGFARTAQHAAVSEVASQPLQTIAWSAVVDLAPPITSSGALAAHYATPLISRRNTVVMAVRTGADDSFRIEARRGGSGTLAWAMATAWKPPPHRWLPTLQTVIAPDGRLLVPTSAGRVLVRRDVDALDAASGGTVDARVFYGDAVYASAPAAHDEAVFIATPLTCDRAGNVYFGFTVTASLPSGLASGFARLGVDGNAVWVAASTAAEVQGGAGFKPATNAAPALSNDESTLYVVVNEASSEGPPSGRLLALDARTLTARSSTALVDPLSGTPAWVSNDATASPTVGPDGDVYLGVLEANAPAHGFRGWLLHFDATLAQSKTPGTFGWDSTASIVPRSMVPQYAGASSYLLLMKANSYAGVGSGDGRHRVLVVDPDDTQVDPYAGTVTVMREVLGVLGPTPSAAAPGAVEEWCINTAAVDPATQSVLMNNEDGVTYRWHLPSNTLSERVRLNNGYLQAYTPTAIGPDGRVYAINNARLFALGR